MTQTGDRELVLARLRLRTVAPPPVNLAHPMPPTDASSPVVRSHLLDGDDAIVEVFCRTAADAGCGIHRDGTHGIDAAVDTIVARHGVTSAVVTDEPVAAPVADALRRRSVRVISAADRAAAAAADLGLTSCRAAVAATGSVVVGSDVAGARWASLLPRVHLCVVRESDIVGATAEVLGRFDAGGLPAVVAFISGPSRTGDIEQILTRGVHGPVAVEVVVVTGS